MDGFAIDKTNTKTFEMPGRCPFGGDRIGGALETGRLTVNVRQFAAASDRRYITRLLHQVLLTFLAAAFLIKDLRVMIEGGNVSAALVLVGIQLAIALLNAGSMSG